jgi:hypothetical protein
MDIAQLVLEYVQALAWPLVVGASVYAFRKQIAAKLKDLTDVSTPLGGAKFDRAAKEIEAKADLAAARQEAKSPPPATSSTSPEDARSDVDNLTDKQKAELDSIHEDSVRAWEADRRAYWAVSAAASEIMEPSDFDTALEVAAASPSAAVMLAYSQLEEVARAAWTVSRMGAESPPRGGVAAIVTTLTHGDLDEGFVQVARDLTDLRNRVAHGAGDVSANGALDFIAACEQLARPLAWQAISRLRHPSRASLLMQWTERYAMEN